jgi:hypothetical protein
VWVKGKGETPTLALSLPASYRKVAMLPDLSPWGNDIGCGAAATESGDERARSGYALDCQN